MSRSPCQPSTTVHRILPCTITTRNMRRKNKQKKCGGKVCHFPLPAINEHKPAEAGRQILARRDKWASASTTTSLFSSVPLSQAITLSFLFFQHLTAGWRFWKTSCIIVFHAEGSNRSCLVLASLISLRVFPVHDQQCLLVTSASQQRSLSKAKPREKCHNDITRFAG